MTRKIVFVFKAFDLFNLNTFNSKTELPIVSFAEAKSLMDDLSQGTF